MVTQREFCAIIWRISNFKTIIYPSKVIIFTDNANYIFNNFILSSMTHRLKLSLEENYYTIKHKKGI